MKHALHNMLRLETAAADWWQRMSAHEQDAYLRAHPGSKMGHSRDRVHAVMRHYLANGPERKSAEHHLLSMGVPLPEEPLPKSRIDRYQRETVHRPTHRPPRKSTSGGGVHTGTDAQSASDDLVRKYGAYAPEVHHGHTVNHGIRERDAKKLHKHLTGGGWHHERYDAGNRSKIEVNEYHHPDGGRITMTRKDGSGTLTGVDRYAVNTHGGHK